MIGLFKTILTIVGALFVINWAVARTNPELSETAKSWLSDRLSDLPENPLSDRIGEFLKTSSSDEVREKEAAAATNPMRGNNYHMSGISPNSAKFGRVLQKVREVPGSASLSTAQFLDQLKGGKVFPVVMDNNSNRCSNCRGFKKVLKGTDAPHLNARPRSARSSPTWRSGASSAQLSGVPAVREISGKIDCPECKGKGFVGSPKTLQIRW